MKYLQFLPRDALLVWYMLSLCVRPSALECPWRLFPIASFFKCDFSYFVARRAVPLHLQSILFSIIQASAWISEGQGVTGEWVPHAEFVSDLNLQDSLYLWVQVLFRTYL